MVVCHYKVTSGEALGAEITVAIRDRMRDTAAQFLRPGETIQVVFQAQTASPRVLNFIGYAGAVGDLFRPVWVRSRGGLGDFIGRFLCRYRIFAVTDQRILVLGAGKVRTSKARGVVTELPRLTMLGPAAGKWQAIQVGAEELRVYRRFFKDIVAADRYVRIATHHPSSGPQQHEPPTPG